MRSSLLKQGAYEKFVKEVLKLIQQAQLKTASSLNHELIVLYFRIGHLIVEKQQKEGWGRSIIEKLSKDIARNASDIKGFSPDNLWKMRQFFIEYRNNKSLQTLAFRAPWGQNILIFSKVKEEKERQYYLQRTIEAGWSRNVLLNQVKAKAYKKHISSPKLHNFKKALPVHLSAQAHEVLKSEYTLSFLGINEPLQERELENKLVAQIKDFILELGYGFAYIGNQYKLNLRSKEYFVDLLFYQRKLKCLVAIDLKIGTFEPEFAGKMNFYLNLLNKQMRLPEENPSIGIILCAEKDNVEVEYALMGMKNPIGVAEYSYQKKLPASLKGELPGAAELKKKVTEELKKSKRNA